MAYTEEQINKIFKTICERVSNGEALRNVINKPDTFSSTVFYELIEDDKKNEQYTRAREERSDKIFEEILEISDNTIEGTVIETDDHGRTKEKKGDMLGHRKLKIDARKWILSKMDHTKYGDKLETTQKNTNINYNATVTKEEAKEISDALEDEC